MKYAVTRVHEASLSAADARKHTGISLFRVAGKRHEFERRDRDIIDVSLDATLSLAAAAAAAASASRPPVLESSRRRLLFHLVVSLSLTHTPPRDPGNMFVAHIYARCLWRVNTNQSSIK